MTPTAFLEQNRTFMKPPDMTDTQCLPIGAFVGEVNSGPCEGVPMIVTAWKPSVEELQLLNEGEAVFIGFLGGTLPPHILGTSFKQVTNPR